MISERSIIVQYEGQVSCDLAGDAVILNLRSGVYYDLNAVGARIWHVIQEPRTVNEIQEMLLNEYEVEPEDCKRDLLALLQKLADEGLVEVRDETLP